MFFTSSENHENTDTLVKIISPKSKWKCGPREVIWGSKLLLPWEHWGQWKSELPCWCTQRTWGMKTKPRLPPVRKILTPKHSSISINWPRSPSSLIPSPEGQQGKLPWQKAEGEWEEEDILETGAPWVSSQMDLCLNITSMRESH